MTAKSALIVGCVFFGGAVYGLNTNKMRVTTVCQDARLFMDGGVDASIESGGLNFHRTIDVFIKHNLKDKILGTLSVTSEVSGLNTPVETFSGPDVKLVIHKDSPAGPRGFQSRLDAKIGNVKYSVAMLCRRK